MTFLYLGIKVLCYKLHGSEVRFAHAIYISLLCTLTLTLQIKTLTPTPTPTLNLPNPLIRVLSLPSPPAFPPPAN